MHRRNSFTPEEVKFIVDEAKRISPNDIVQAGKQVSNLHREVYQVRGWSRRTVGSIQHKLYRIKNGWDEQPVVNGVERERGSVESAYATFRQRIQAAETRFQSEQREAKQEFQKAIRDL